jgi:hypothetical protein
MGYTHVESINELRKQKTCQSEQKNLAGLLVEVVTCFPESHPGFSPDSDPDSDHDPDPISDSSADLCILPLK